MAEPSYLSKNESPGQQMQNGGDHAGHSMMPPQGGLNGGATMQMFSPGGGPSQWMFSTNYRFDTGKINAADLSDPEIIWRLEQMDAAGLMQYKEMVSDAAVASWIEQRLLQVKVPDAAKIGDTRDKVQAKDRKMYDELVKYLAEVQGKIGGMLASPPKGYEYMKGNANVNEVVARLGRLVSELQSEKLTVRFDPALLSGTTAASYGIADSTISLRPITNQVDKVKVAISIIHEFMHTEQDREMEKKIRASKSRNEHTEEDDITHEVEGRKSGIYMTFIMEALGEYKLGAHASFGEHIANRMFLTRFETEQKDPDSKAGKAATKENRAKIKTAYSKQIARNAPSATYTADLDASNHILLNHNGATIDLGVVPDNVRTSDQLSVHLITQIDALSNRKELFTGAGNKDLKHIIVVVFYGGKKLAEFVHCNKGSTNGSCNP